MIGKLMTSLCLAAFPCQASLPGPPLPADKGNGMVCSGIVQFYKKPREILKLPPSTLKIGPDNAKVKLVIFNDFLCMACYQGYLAESRLVSRFDHEIQLIYYNFPLDQTCNPYISKTVYANSSLASLAMLAASEEDVLRKYMFRHFSLYNDISECYSRDIAMKMSLGLVDPHKFNNHLDDPLMTGILRRDVELAHKLGINATPTLFINGRRIIGLPPQGVLEGIVKREVALSRIAK